MAAAVRSRAREWSGSRWRRAVSTSETAAGRSAPRTASAGIPRSAASRAYSTRKNGLPSVRSRSASAARELGRVRVTPSTTVAASSADNPFRARRRPWRRASISVRSASAPVGAGWARQVVSTSSDARSVLSASRRSTRSVAGSAQCRSSRTSRVACSRAAASTVWMICSQTANWLTSCSSAPSPGRLRPRPRSTADHGHSGGAPSS